MDKQELQQLVSISDDIAFIEKLEQIAKNSNDNLKFMVMPESVGIRFFNGMPCQSGFTPIVLPKELSKHVMATLVSYKDSLQDMMDNLYVVDRSMKPEDPPYPTEEEESSDD